MQTSKAIYTFYLPSNLNIGFLDSADCIATSNKDDKYNIIIYPPIVNFLEFLVNYTYI